MDIATLKAGRTLLKEQSYELKDLYRGYADRSLYINITDNNIQSKPVTQWMKDKFVGGKGFGLQ